MRKRFAWWTALPLALVPTIAAAQTTSLDPLAPAPPTTTTTAQPASTEPEQIIEFSSDQVVYDSDNDIVTATGTVRMKRDGDYVAADQIVWNRKNPNFFVEPSFRTIGDRMPPSVSVYCLSSPVLRSSVHAL